jgi:hypothetical protein
MEKKDKSGYLYREVGDVFMSDDGVELMVVPVSHFKDKKPGYCKCYYFHTDNEGGHCLAIQNGVKSTVTGLCGKVGRPDGIGVSFPRADETDFYHEGENELER